MKVENALAQEQLKGYREEVGGARTALNRLGMMEHEFDSLPKTGLLSPGAFADARSNLVKNLSGVLTTAGGKPIAPEQMSAIESISKDTTRLGFELSKTLGTREAAQIVQQSIGANPGINNTALGFKRLVSSLKAAQQYNIDRATFMDRYYQNNGTLNGSDAAFNESHPSSDYVKMGIAGSVDPKDIAGFKNAPAEQKSMWAAAIDKKYGKGVSSMIGGE